MNSNEDLERRIRTFLASRAPVSPPGVLEAVLRETADHPQHPRGLALAAVGRFGLAVAAVAAAVTVAVVFGSGLVPSSGAPGVHSTQSPTATPAQTAAPSMTIVILPVPVKEKAIAEEALTVFEARLRALGIGTFVASIGDDIRFRFFLPPTVSQADVDMVLHSGGRLEWLAWLPDSAPAPVVGAAVPDGTLVLFDQSHITSVTLTTTSNSTSATPAVQIHLDALAMQAFATYTASHIGQPGPVALDGRILTLPIIQGAITGGDLIISFPSVQEPGALSAAALAALLTSGPVPSGWFMSSGEPLPTTSGSSTAESTATP